TDPRPLSEHRRTLSLAEMQTAFDFEPVFFGNVLLPIYDYTAHGEGSEFTLRRNRQAFDWVNIVPSRAAVPASQVDLSSELLGVKMKFPIIVGPSTGQGALHPDGEIGMFRGATAASNTPMIIASGSTIPVAKVVTLLLLVLPLQQQRLLQEVQRLLVRCDTGSAAGAYGIRGNISTLCGKWSKASCSSKGFWIRKTPGWRSNTARMGSPCPI